MNEVALSIKVSTEVRLEALFHQGDRAHAALLCHPHPLYGGTMDNAVVLAARDALAGLGFSTLRFNFRGVGRSAGSHAGGEAAALDVLAARAGVRSDVHVVAYSYGAWVAVRCLAAGLRPASATLVSPPVSFPALDFAGLALPRCRTLIVTGDRDDFCARAALERWIGARADEAHLVVIPGADHFYWGAEPRLVAALVEFYSLV
jgi:alpha/beta superfamily hydrolase